MDTSIPKRNRLSPIMAGVLCGLIGAASAAVHAAEDPMLAAAKSHFKAGSALFEADDFAGALREFEAARGAKAMAAFSYNIGVCLEHLDRPAEAIAAFERFIDGTIDPAAIAEAREHIAAMRKEKAIAATAPPEKRIEKPFGRDATEGLAPGDRPAKAAIGQPEAPPRALEGRAAESDSGRRISAISRFAAPIAVGVIALAIVGTGAGLVGSVGPEYDQLRSQWLGVPGPSLDLQSQAHALADRERAGDALIGIGAAAVAVDAILWGLAARKPAGERHAYIAPTLGGMVVGGTF